MITEEVKKLHDYIENNFPHFELELEVPLKKLFPEPENKGLKHIWKYGAADLVAKRNNKIVAIFEPGGKHHWEERQSLNDRRKYKLCEINGVGCLTMMNSVLGNLSKRKLRKLIGSYLWK